jgi:hypothetical protein
MSGFGIHEQFEAGTIMWAEGKRWREEAFLQQLSQNGSMMLAVNHDLLWRECLERILGQPRGSEWSRMSGLLRAMPASMARQRLWRASEWWLVETQRLHLNSMYFVMEGGAALSELLDNPLSKKLQDDLALRSHQLEELSWCLEDQSQETIAIVE